MADETRTIKTDYLARVEGEGGMLIRLKGGEIEEVKLNIFEPPRFFEAFLRGRYFTEAPDITARICGICPVAYQTAAINAMESICGADVGSQIKALRRLLYCGEWIESHALHIYFLHAPDFLGYESGITMAADHRPLVEQALKMKKAGNRLITILGGRPIHPVSVRVGGWSHVPRISELKEHRAALEEGLAFAQETVKIVSGFTMPAFAREPRLVSLRHPAEYPFNDGRIVSSDGVDVAPSGWREAFEEFQVQGTNALHARSLDGKGAYLLGPAARVVLAGEQLHPLAKEALAASGYADLIRTNIYASIVARAVELVHAFAEAIDIIDAYRVPSEPLVAWQSRPGVAAWATEAPRGLLFHRYEVDEFGRIRTAQIVPPTSQNQAAIEADLIVAAKQVLDLPHAEATLRLEQMIRSYDPCISCATHFLDLRVDEV